MRFPRRKRLLRALKPLLILWGIAGVLLLATLGADLVVTPLLLGIGGFLAYRAWRGECEVLDFEGYCPRCSAALELRRGANIRLPLAIDCHTCHSHPQLRAGAPRPA